MQYLIEPIGAEFSNRAVKALSDRFSAKAAEGYHLHSVFQVTQPGCLGIGSPSITNLAIYEKADGTAERTEPVV